MTARRICWPDPDATCLHGGCLYCNDQPFRALSTIERWARTAGVVRHRGRGEQDALEAYRYGRDHGFGNAETRQGLQAEAECRDA